MVDRLNEAGYRVGRPQEGFGSIAEGDATRALHEIGIYPEALPRQLMAIVQAGDRSESVASISVPTLVQHGADDTMFPPPHGEHTATLIKGSRLVIYPGMGHNLPQEVLPAVVDDMVMHFRATD